MRAFLLSKKDSVAVALKSLGRGEKIKVGGLEIKLKNRIPRGHKFALRKIEKGGEILKDGEIIGVALKEIEKGQHVHVHNLGSRYDTGKC